MQKAPLGYTEECKKLPPFLWFDTQAEEAANLYVSVFPDGKVINVSRYTAEGARGAGMPEGAAMVVEFEIMGQKFNALNGGPHFKFTPAVSFMVSCESQEEVDHYWNLLSEGGAPEAQQCGWLADRYGLSWQIVPTILGKLMSDPDKAKAGRAMQAMLSMKKIDIAKLEEAFNQA